MIKAKQAPNPSGEHSQLRAVAKRKVLIRSYGCQMNVYDSDRLMDSLVSEGYAPTESQDDASVIILNTCHIREKASEKVYSELGRLRKLKSERAQSNNPMQIAVTGCVAQAEGAELIRRQPAVDLVVGPQSYHRFGRLLSRTNSSGRQVDTEFPIESKFQYLPQPSQERLMARGYSAFVTVQEGCDKFCTFCVVPYTRGAEFSRPASDILDEIRRLADAGVREVTLIGQNVNAYHGIGRSGRNISLADLISAVADLENIDRIRYTTSHPRDMSSDLIDMHISCAKLMPYLHLPVQSGSDRILADMNRKHTANEYRYIVDEVRKRRPDIAMSSDFIVGFPGETEEDFSATIRLIEDIGFASAFSFKYSKRPGTPGFELGDNIPALEKSRRLEILQSLLDTQRQGFNQRCIGQILPVLLDKDGRYEGQLTGKTPYMQTVQVNANGALKGEIVSVEVTQSEGSSLFGSIIGE